MNIHDAIQGLSERDLFALLGKQRIREILNEPLAKGDNLQKLSDAGAVELFDQIKEILDEQKPLIENDFRTHEDDEPEMQVTFATDDEGEALAFQTGDNSFSGGCYLYPHWAVVYLCRDSDTSELAKEAARELLDLIQS